MIKNTSIILCFLFSILFNRAFSQSQTFKSSGTWTCPYGVTSVTVECWGGGGGGGGASSAGKGGSGGGSGSYVKKVGITVTPCSTYTIVVGNGGLGGGSTITTLPAGEGGSSYFGNISLIYAKGGCGALGDAGEAGVGGCSGQSTSTCLNFSTACVPSISDGINNFLLAGKSGTKGSTTAGGAGGTAQGLNGGLGGAALSTCKTGNPGIQPGGGGGGAFMSSSNCFFGQKGGDGAPGGVRITWTGSAAGPSGGSIVGPSQICDGATNIKFTYSGGTPTPDAWLWTPPNGTSITSGQYTTDIVTTWGSSSGEISVSALANGNPGCPIKKSVTVIPQPIGPILQTKTPDGGDAVAGQGASATFSAGVGGVGCVDDYVVIIDGGNAQPYVPGSTVGTEATSSIVIQGRRAGCTPDRGCNGTDYVTLASWTIGNPTSIELFNSKNDFFSIQPNPASDLVNILFKSGFKPSGIQLFDALGRIIDGNSGSTINVRNLPNGMYHIAVTSREGRFTKAFVVAH